ncbi:MULTISPECIES: ferredoxin--NADP reductase [Prauserella salsuginis group]|uniref:2Fe-2S iron-sulfur cluster-binding protein n=1 Tax=Prauserella salsuginis TaxID=387889 RepID=A0ABW6G303_9PSEU|nr:MULTISPECIES: ferredoxin--NADP reductase [Prauserella salsuginis group]MCR3718461.1 3-ketosteroid 9alpha-monooxygenase subunit B [Prauserella flava]MCR3733031.1 3-ketosteroid 9alpha-monooxygenase subunit B [Prauserella salsuginis]
MSGDGTVRVQRLRVAEVVDETVVDETAAARSIVFDAELDYRPGQFLTVRVPGDERGPVARCYSLSSSPYTGDRPQVTVKRDGYASNWLCDHIAAGDELDVLPASGVFTPADLDADLALFAGGSGITPMLSIVRSVLAHGTGAMTLVYANADEPSVIFAGVLRELEEAYPGRLTVVHWLETLQGLPTTERLAPIAELLAGRETFVCGPAPYMRAVVAAAKAAGTPRARIHRETFVSLGGDPFAAAEPGTGDLAANAAPAAASDSAGDDGSDLGGQDDRSGDVSAGDGTPDGTDEAPARITVDLDGTTTQHSWPRGAKLLDVLLAAGRDAPYSCREGQCSACACRVTSGEVKMLNNEVLDSDDVADGIVLACQSLPLTDDVSISYE